MGVFVQTRIIQYEFLHHTIMLPGPGSVYNNILRMIRERQVILKAALHFRLAV